MPQYVRTPFVVDAPPRQPADSINATLAPDCAASTAAATPAEPPPTTTTSYWRIIATRSPYRLHVDLFFEIRERDERAPRQDAAVKDRKHALDLTQPGGVLGREVPRP